MTRTAPDATSTSPSATEDCLIGVDFGERRIGIAVAEGRVAVPIGIIEHENRASDIERVAAIVRERHAARVVVGLPLLFSGEEGEQARRSRRFGDALARVVDADVVYHDERLSSADAAASAPAGRRIDDRAAAIILQSYIDAAERAS